MITMLLGRLCHRAAWTFMVWRGLHGSINRNYVCYPLDDAKHFCKRSGNKSIPLGFRSCLDNAIFLDCNFSRKWKTIYLFPVLIPLNNRDLINKTLKRIALKNAILFTYETSIYYNQLLQKKRKSLADENKALKYARCAFSEIVLVVIGI